MHPVHNCIEKTLKRVLFLHEAQYGRMSTVSFGDVPAQTAAQRSLLPLCEIGFAKVLQLSFYEALNKSKVDRGGGRGGRDLFISTQMYPRCGNILGP